MHYIVRRTVLRPRHTLCRLSHESTVTKKAILGNSKTQIQRAKLNPNSIKLPDVSVIITALLCVLDCADDHTGNASMHYTSSPHSPSPQ